MRHGSVVLQGVNLKENKRKVKYRFRPEASILQTVVWIHTRVRQKKEKEKIFPLRRSQYSGMKAGIMSICSYSTSLCARLFRRGVASLLQAPRSPVRLL